MDVLPVVVGQPPDSASRGDRQLPVPVRENGTRQRDRAPVSRELSALPLVSEVENEPACAPVRFDETDAAATPVREPGSYPGAGGEPCELPLSASIGVHHVDPIARLTAESAVRDLPAVRRPHRIREDMARRQSASVAS